jgi:hypothetical protein
MATTTPNFGWSVPTSTDLVKDGATAIETLGDAIDASLVDLKGGTTGQILSKNSNTDMDFTWVSDATGMTNPMTTTGDTIYSSSGSTPARLGIGSTGQILTVAGGLPSWASPAAGGGMTLLSTTAITAAATIEITGISQTYNQLIVVMSNAATVAVDNNAALQFNSDTGTNYTWGASELINNTTSGNANTSEIRWLQGATTTTNVNNIISVMTITRYADTTPNKLVQINTTYIGGTSSARKALTVVGSYRGTSGISSIKYLSSGGLNYTAQGNIYIYGVK